MHKFKTQNICFMHSWLTPKRLNCCRFCQFVSSLVLVSLSFVQTELVEDPHVQPKQVSTSSPTLDTRPSCQDAPFTVAVPAPSDSPGKDSYDILIKNCEVNNSYVSIEIEQWHVVGFFSQKEFLVKLTRLVGFVVQCRSFYNYVRVFDCIFSQN